MRRPNFVFIFADDWGWGDLGCYGHEVIKTPNLDRLAAEGRLFTQFYVCSGVCSPSRTAVMTGQFPARHTIHGHLAEHRMNQERGMPDWLDPAATTYTRLLQGAGYRVGHYGKWHLGNGEGAPDPAAYGIDDSRVNAGPRTTLEFGREQWAPGLRARSSEFIVNHAMRFIDDAADQPFFINVWLNDTHAILDPTPEQLEAYEHTGPQLVGEYHKGATAIYYATATEADRQIGRLLDHLEQRGLRDDTVVIFSSDNGPEDILVRNAAHSGVGSAGPFRGRKRSLYEGGVRVPFVMRWPGGGGPVGAVDDDTPLCAVDLLPTFCRLAGVDLPAELALDGEDMSDVFAGATRGRATPLFWEWRFSIVGHVINRSPMLSVRDGRWKALANPDQSRLELYDVRADPMELDNRVSEHRDVAEELAARALAWQRELPAGPVSDDAGSNAYPWPTAGTAGAAGGARGAGGAGSAGGAGGAP